MGNKSLKIKCESVFYLNTDKTMGIATRTEPVEFSVVDIDLLRSALNMMEKAGNRNITIALASNKSRAVDGPNRLVWIGRKEDKAGIVIAPMLHEC
jgi:hypothetical protein